MAAQASKENTKCFDNIDFTSKVIMDAHSRGSTLDAALGDSGTAEEFMQANSTDKREADTLTGTQVSICLVCDKLKEMLLNKNRKYGDSAVNPLRLFSKASPVEQIKVRIDDKLSRLRNEQLDDEDILLDLMGYLVLLYVAKEKYI